MKCVDRVDGFQALQKRLCGEKTFLPAGAEVAGHSRDRILAAWPSLDAEKVKLATIYTEASPLRGRLRASPDLTTMMARNGGNNEGWTSHDQRGSTGRNRPASSRKLFIGSVPERADELSSLWKDLDLVFRLLPDDHEDGRLIMDVGSYRYIRFNHHVVRSFWIGAFAAWEGYRTVAESKDFRAALQTVVQSADTTGHTSKTRGLTGLCFPPIVEGFGFARFGPWSGRQVIRLVVHRTGQEPKIVLGRLFDLLTVTEGSIRFFM